MKDRDRFGKTSLVRFAGRTIAIRLDPFRVLNTQVIMDSLLEFAIRVNLGRRVNCVSRL